MTGSKVVFFNLPAHGHVNPTLAVVKELVARGEDVTYYAGRDFAEQIEAVGAHFQAYPDLPDIDPAEVSGNFVCLLTLLIEIGLKITPTVLEQLKAIQPDYIMYDSMCLPGKLIARILGLPAISSSSIFVFNRESLAKTSRGFTWSNLRMLARSLPCIWRFRRAANQFTRRYHIQRPRMFDTFGSDEALSIVYTSRELQPNGTALDDSYHFVGPSIVKRDTSGDFPFDQLDGRRLIYISMGTLFNKRLAFYKLCMDTFGDSDCQVVLSVGQRIDIATLGAIPANFIVRNTVPQLDVLERADLFITHGGMNSVHEGLYFGVPLLVIPQMGEQSVVADQVVRVDAGIRLNNGDLTINRLRDTAERLLREPAFRENSRRIGDTLKSAGGYQRAVDAIFAYKARLGIRE